MDTSKISESKRFIDSILELLKNELDQDTIDSVRHFMENDEVEMAFEGLFIEIMNLKLIPKIDFIKSRQVAIILNLNKESVFDVNFWNKFDKYTKEYNGKDDW